MVAGEEPVEECGAGPTDMQEAGRRGGETDDDAHRGYVGAGWRSRHCRSRRTVMAGLDPAIHETDRVDPRDAPGDDGRNARGLRRHLAEIIALADGDAGAAQDVVGGCRVEADLEHRKMQQVV